MRRARNNDLTFTLIFWGAIIAAITIGWMVSRYRRKKRAEALVRVAEELGLDYTAQATEDIVAGFGPFQLFSRGRAKKVFNLMQGASGDRGLAIFDYQFVTGSGKSTKTWRYTVLCIQFDGQAAPTFSLRPENFGDKIISWFRSSDIDFDTHPTFSKRYLLRGDDEAAVRALFTPPVLEYFEDRKALCAEAMGQTLLVYRLGRVPPQNIGTHLGDGLELLSLINRTS
jgi:hypothetical protein